MPNQAIPSLFHGNLWQFLGMKVGVKRSTL